jgi:hypothetical protein
VWNGNSTHLKWASLVSSWLNLIVDVYLCNTKLLNPPVQWDDNRIWPSPKKLLSISFVPRAVSDVLRLKIRHLKVCFQDLWVRMLGTTWELKAFKVKIFCPSMCVWKPAASSLCECSSMLGSCENSIDVSNAKKGQNVQMRPVHFHITWPRYICLLTLELYICYWSTVSILTSLHESVLHGLHPILKSVHWHI